MGLLVSVKTLMIHPPQSSVNGVIEISSVNDKNVQQGRQRVASHRHRLGPAYFVSEDEKLCPNSDNLLLSTWVMTGVMSSKQQSFETLKCVQRSQKNLDIFHGGRRLGYAEITHSGNYNLAEKVEIFSYQERSILTNR